MTVTTDTDVESSIAQNEVIAAAAPNLSGPSYNELNPLSDVSWKYGCTRYAWGRLHELTGEHLYLWSGGAMPWYDLAIYHGYEVGIEPRVNAIAVWDNTAGGHVAFVEEVSSTHVTVTEGGYINGPGYAGNKYCNREKLRISTMNRVGAKRDNSIYNDTLIGYIYVRQNHLVSILSGPDTVMGDIIDYMVVGETYEYEIIDPVTGEELRRDTGDLGYYSNDQYSRYYTHDLVNQTITPTSPFISGGSVGPEGYIATIAKTTLTVGTAFTTSPR